MTVYYANNKFINNASGKNTVQSIYNATGDTSQVGTFAVITALAAGDTIHMMTIPPGVIITDVVLDVDPLDTGTGITLEVGDTTTANNYIASGAFGQSGAGSISHANVPGLLKQSPYAAATDLVVTCTHAATTALLTGSIRLQACYSAIA